MTAGTGARDEHGPWHEDGPGPSPGSSSGSCGAHAGIGADLRGTALHLLDRVREVVEPLGESGGPAPDPDSAPAPGSAGACQACPVCAVIAMLRGERSELATRLAEHATGLLAVLKAVLEADAARERGGGENAHPPTGRADHAHSGRADHAHTASGARPESGTRRPGPHRPSGRPVQRIVVHRR
ncbi:hypothetical protein EV383_2005 [Pseudonocardia sediminis]|uniref:Uncharacterized protein n=1 Tax=Pseudonocardia sediminis TaxID=1397368 RepID=A0A4Q7UW94_PSEST|nr:hypothetical protein [Pseudonocardia sediminis]RZT85141.1 hypothetical protein EV383_2005 [Pseudonocardia sediminis]